MGKLLYEAIRNGHSESYYYVVRSAETSSPFFHIAGVEQETHLGQVLLLVFHLFSPPTELLDTDSQSAAFLDHLFLAI